MQIILTFTFYVLHHLFTSSLPRFITHQTGGYFHQPEFMRSDTDNYRKFYLFVIFFFFKSYLIYGILLTKTVIFNRLKSFHERFDYFGGAQISSTIVSVMIVSCVTG